MPMMTMQPETVKNNSQVLIAIQMTTGGQISLSDASCGVVSSSSVPEYTVNTSSQVSGNSGDVSLSNMPSDYGENATPVTIFQLQGTVNSNASSQNLTTESYRILPDMTAHLTYCSQASPILLAQASPSVGVPLSQSVFIVSSTAAKEFPEAMNSDMYSNERSSDSRHSISLSVAALSESEASVEIADPSNPRPTDLTCLLPTLTDSASTSTLREKSGNIGRKVDAQECDIQQSNIDSVVVRKSESGLEMFALDRLEQSKEKSTSKLDPLIPLYKYMINNKCMLCGFESKAKELRAARSHLLVHITTKDFKCDICDKSFSTEKYLAAHRNVHTNVFPFSCDVCGKKCRSKQTLRNHKKETHVERRKWKCEVCDKDLATHLSLKEHLRIHTGERPFVCPICKKGFRLRKGLTDHLRSKCCTPKPHQSLTTKPHIR